MEEPVPISAIQHYAYCPRQYALIHIEQIWEDNLYTLRGHRAHAQVHTPEGMAREGMRVEYGLPLWSDQLGLVGQADVVEFLEDTPYPVEHKVGERRARHADTLQLTAQGLCLEEMFSVPVRKGALYYRQSRRRREVTFTPALRAEVMEVLQAIRTLQAHPALPPPVNDARCKDCSLVAACLPQARDRLEGLT
ncbi:CRISPR-associated protein Cas4 [Marinithermus hydrothermalis]|uniref:CRISPR-associated exonuclease Cas4 n=1 Tax=Marinithermus hydrothermalis (strain DSM 14884 / JCM 11576 / T1) TaxID=869210 RepID=F2NNM4_MARHT|nr:CRISPR-associated protein Cas4 [Marinithermus hydrothermalis]AEB11039.1 CRISPR-associated protein Cas4 [Marinithermus hydrothermalis DSM 14884]